MAQVSVIAIKWITFNLLFYISTNNCMDICCRYWDYRFHSRNHFSRLLLFPNPQDSGRVMCIVFASVNVIRSSILTEEYQNLLHWPHIRMLQLRQILHDGSVEEWA